MNNIKVSSSAGRARICLIAAAIVLLVVASIDAAAQRRGGGGGGRMAQSSVASGNHSAGRGGSANRAGSANTQNRNNTQSRNNTGNRSGNTVNAGNRVNTGDINIDRGDVNIDVDGGYGRYRHPVAAGAFIGAMAVTTAAVIGSYYYALPPTGCTTVITNGITYQQCGSVYYQQTMSGNDVVYVVVDP